LVLDEAEDAYDRKEAEMGAEAMRLVERLLMLQTIDRLWVEHLTAMDELRQGIGLQAYGQQDPLVMYKREAHDMWQQLLAAIQDSMSSNEEEAITVLRDQIAEGEHWYLALLKAMSRWSLAEECVDGRIYRYLIGGEAFDWLVLAERLLEELDGEVSEADRYELLFNGQPPIEVDDEDFQLLIGTPKYQAYLNFLYGVTVEEALIYTVEEEI